MERLSNWLSIACSTVGAVILALATASAVRADEPTPVTENPVPVITFPCTGCYKTDADSTCPSCSYNKIGNACVQNSNPCSSGSCSACYCNGSATSQSCQ